MSDKNQATLEQARQMQMGASPVPPARGDAPAIALQQPEYPPDILPIYILKTDPKAAAAAAEAAAHAAKPAMPQVAVANVDDPTSPPHVPTEDPPAAPGLYVGVLGRAESPPAQHGSKR